MKTEIIMKSSGIIIEMRKRLNEDGVYEVSLYINHAPNHAPRYIFSETGHIMALYNGEFLGELYPSVVKYFKTEDEIERYLDEINKVYKKILNNMWNGVEYVREENGLEVKITKFNDRLGNRYVEFFITNTPPGKTSMIFSKDGSIHTGKDIECEDELNPFVKKQFSTDEEIRDFVKKIAEVYK